MVVDVQVLSGFCVGVTADRGAWEQVRLFADCGARVLHGATVYGVAAMRPPDEQPALTLLRAVCGGSVDAVTFLTAGSMSNLFRLAAEAGMEPCLRSALNGVVVVGCSGAAFTAATTWGLTGALEVDRNGPSAMVAAVTEALVATVKVLNSPSAQAEIRGRLVVGGGAVIRLTSRERAVMAALARRPGAVVSKDSLLREAWAPDRARSHTVEVTVGRLRQKVQPAGIVVGTARRRGYWLELEGAAPTAPTALTAPFRPPLAPRP